MTHHRRSLLLALGWLPMFAAALWLLTDTELTRNVRIWSGAAMFAAMFCWNEVIPEIKR
jgi:hypothetical protein